MAQAQTLTVLGGRLRVATCGGPLVLSPNEELDEPCCCENCDCSPKTYSYNSGNTDPPGSYKGFDQCPNVWQPGDGGSCEDGGSCAKETISGYLNGPVVCCKCAKNKNPKVRILSATMDNAGKIGDWEIPMPPGCPVAIGSAGGGPNDITDAELQRDGFPGEGPGLCRLRVTFEAKNGPGGGPVGFLGATVVFYFEDPDNPLP